MLCKISVHRQSWRLVVVAIVGGSACAPQTPSAESPSHRTESAAGDSALEQTPEVQPVPASDGEASSEPEPAANAPSPPSATALSTLCGTMCGAQSSKCKPAQIEACQRNYCERYGAASEVCEPSVRSALECAKAQPHFLLCSNIVPDTCSKKFRAAEDCVATGEAPTVEDDEPRVPEGWAKYAAPQAAFTVTMPKGVTVKTANGVKSWDAEDGGAKYEIRREPRPDVSRFNQKGFLRVATQLLGPCAPRMKLYALVELEDRSMIQFQTTCPDKTQQRGMLYIHGSNYFVLRATWGEGPNPDAETFVYSFVRP